MLTLPVVSEPSNPVTGKSTTQQAGALLHDLRQPLSVIEMCADYLAILLPPEQSLARQQIAMVQAQVDLASRILCDTVRMLQGGQCTSVAQASRSRTKSESAPVT